MVIVLYDFLARLLVDLYIIIVLQSGESLFNRLDKGIEVAIAVLKEVFEYAIGAFSIGGNPNAKVAVVLDRKIGEFVIDR